MINFISKPDGPLWEGLSYAILFFVFSEARSLILNIYVYLMFRMGTKFQTTLTAAVYKKVGHISLSVSLSHIALIASLEYKTS